jgi:dipeptidyl aminopeptidase/acylaminoacyl peptidase
MARPTEVAKIDMAGGQFSMITDVNGHIYESIKMGKSEERYIKTQDGKDLQMWIIYPPDFDPAKKYPALYCKGGAGGPSQSGATAGTTDDGSKRLYRGCCQPSRQLRLRK